VVDIASASNLSIHSIGSEPDFDIKSISFELSSPSPFQVASPPLEAEIAIANKPLEGEPWLRIHWFSTATALQFLAMREKQIRINSNMSYLLRSVLG
jgi:hypothetical protein